MQADILQVPVRRPAHLETTSLGAALAAGIGVGMLTAEQAFTDLKHNTGAPVGEGGRPGLLQGRFGSGLCGIVRDGALRHGMHARHVHAARAAAPSAAHTISPRMGWLGTGRDL